jgi:hypothetical protein
MVLILGLVFLASLLFTDYFGAPVITALLYLVMTYRRKIKALENRLSDKGVGKSEVPAPIESPAPPTSTDA